MFNQWETVINQCMQQIMKCANRKIQMYASGYMHKASQLVEIISHNNKMHLLFHMQKSRAIQKILRKKMVQYNEPNEETIPWGNYSISTIIWCQRNRLLTLPWKRSRTPIANNSWVSRSSNNSVQLYHRTMN